MNVLYKKIVGACVLFMAIMSIMGLPYRKMGLDADAFGLCWYASTNPPLEEVVNRSLTYTYYALNEKEPPMNFLSLHRPLQQLANNVAYQLLGWNPYGHFLFTVGWHALSVALLFLIFTFFFPLWLAWLFALGAGLHPALTPSLIGLTVHIPLCFVFLFSSLLLLARYIRTNNTIWYILSGAFYFASLFVYELPLAFPGILLLFYLFFKREWWFKGSWIFFLLNGLFFWIKYKTAVVLMVSDDGVVKNNIFVAALTKVVDNWKQALKPFFGLQNVSNAHALLIIMLIGLIFLAAFLTVSRPVRTRMIFYGMSFVCAAWPTIIGNGSTRYFYCAIPFFILMLYEVLMQFAIMMRARDSKYVVAVGLVAFSIFGAIHATNQLSNREKYTSERDRALTEFCDRYKSEPDLCIVLLSTLHYCNNQIFLMASGMMQVMRHLCDRPDLPVYHVTELVQYAVTEPQVSLEVASVKDGYRLVTPDPNNLFIMSPQCPPQDQSLPFSMGTLVIHSKAASWKTTDVSCIFDKEWINRFKKHKKVIFASWDAASWKLVELNSSHLIS